MSDLAVRVQGLGKRYQIGERTASYQLFRDLLSDGLKRLVSRRKLPERREVWALTDVSFDLHWGEVMGIIGPNGAGKSTLLKILSRITSPTTGEAELYGRIGSLLDVGVGFHPELTGRENIYLSGAILGMRRAEIERRFEEIVSFAAIENFLDTPMKRYSSGMYLRLGFSVAAHLEPDILVVDEVLAVGDAAFQRKCIGKMSETAREGRTVLFVSHNMGIIESLCNRCVLLENGKPVSMGSPTEIISRYFLTAGEETGEEAGGCLKVDRTMLGQETNGFVLKNIRALTENGSSIAILRTNDPLRIEAEFEALEAFRDVTFTVRILSKSGIELIRLSTDPISGYPIRYLEGEGSIELLIDELPLTADDYLIELSFGHRYDKPLAQFNRLGILTVTAKNVYGGNVLMDSSRGYMVVPHHWHLNGVDG
jgi:lipopolysaccharide transport system ATP-binding protein